MPTRNRKIAAWSIGLLVFAILFAAIWYRAHYGLDVTDESYWVAEPYLVLKGAVPFVNLWSQTPSTTLLIAPFVSVYMLLAGGTEGLALFMMLTAVIFRLVVCVGIWALLRRHLGDLNAGTFAAAFFCFSSTGRGMNYNTISLYLLALGGALVFRSLSEDDKKHRGLFSALAGVVMACCALAHNTQIVNCVYFVLVVLCCTEKAKLKGYGLLRYLVAGLGIAIITVIGLEIAGHGGVFSGIDLLLKKNNYFRIEHLELQDQLTRSYDLVKEGGRPWLFGFLCFFAISLILMALFRRKKLFTLRTSIAVALLGGGIVLIVEALLHGVYRNVPTAILFLSAPLFLAAIGKKNRRKAIILFLCYWVPSLFTLLLIAILSHTPADYRYFTLTSGALLYIPFGHFALEEIGTGEENEKPPFFIRLLRVVPALLALLIAVSFVKTAYETVYRDSPIRELDYKVTTGIYKGLYTTRENGEAIERLEGLIREETAGAESVLICDLFPMGYLMTDAASCTPTGWDPNMYRYRFQDMELFKAYFERVGKTPEIILYINSENSKLSIDDPENDFAAFVNEYYTLTSSDGDGRYALRVFERNEQ